VTRRTAPYLVAIGGAIATTAVIGGVSAVASVGSVASLSAFYLLLVLWLAARWGRGPALAGSLSAFLLYDYYFVPPVGTFAVRGPAELLELVVLLAVALVTSQLAASLRRAQATADANLAWLRLAHSSVRGAAGGGAYANYADPELSDWPQAYYGANYARLQRVKAMYDPGEVFTFPQAIRAR